VVERARNDAEWAEDSERSEEVLTFPFPFPEFLLFSEGTARAGELLDRKTPSFPPNLCRLVAGGCMLSAENVSAGNEVSAEDIELVENMVSAEAMAEEVAEIKA
jgi:hypothetical protein